MSITIPTSQNVSRAVDDERDGSATRTIEILDVSRGRITRVDNVACPGELPPLELDVSLPAERAAAQAMWAPAQTETVAFPRHQLIRQVAAVAAALALGIRAGANWSGPPDEDSLAGSLVAGAVTLNGDAREAHDGEIVLSAIVPLHNRGTVPIEVLSGRPSGWQIDQAAVSHQTTAVYPGHWRSIAVSLASTVTLRPH